jgi:hypothetical protein
LWDRRDEVEAYYRANGTLRGTARRFGVTMCLITKMLGHAHTPRVVPHLCDHLDCQHPLPEPGVCREGVGNPCCVSRGPRLAYSGRDGLPPFGFVLDDNMLLTPDPKTHPLLSEMLRLQDSGRSVNQVALALGLEYWRVRNCLSHSGKLERKRRAMVGE